MGWENPRWGVGLCVLKPFYIVSWLPGWKCCLAGPRPSYAWCRPGHMAHPGPQLTIGPSCLAMQSFGEGGEKWNLGPSQVGGRSTSQLASLWPILLPRARCCFLEQKLLSWAPLGKVDFDKWIKSTLDLNFHPSKVHMESWLLIACV
jgi:hypothetical protein